MLTAMAGAVALTAAVTVWSPGTSRAEGEADAAAQAAQAAQAAEARKKAAKVYAEVYGREEEKAAKAPPAAQVEFARKLVAAAKVAEADPALASLLRDKAAEYGSADPAGYPVALEALREELDRSASRAAIIERIVALQEKILRTEKAAGKPKAAAELVFSLRELAFERRRERNFDAAAKALDRAKAVVRQNAKSPKETLADIDAESAALARDQAAAAKLESARKTLKTTPLDPVANTVVGLALLVEDKTDDAAAHLARSGDTAYRKLGETLSKREPKPLDLAEAYKGAAEATGKDSADLRAVLYAKARVLYKAALDADPAGPDAVRLKLILSSLPGSDAPATGGASAAPAETKPVKPVGAGGRAALLAKIQTAVKEKTVTDTEDLGFVFSPEFRDVPEAGALLIGFDLSPHDLGLGIAAVKPIYLTAKGETVGAMQGKPGAKWVRVKAKDGYAVGTLHLKAGAWVEAMQIGFCEIGAEALNPAKSYKSEVFGKRDSDKPEKTLGGEGAPIAGIRGHTVENVAMSALGLVLAPK
jgi:hypothetical protein